MDNKKITCEILFEENSNKVYFGGQKLYGRAILNVTKEKTLKGIFVKITGRANCQWVQGGGDSAKVYHGKEVYLSEKIYLIGGENDEIIIEPGLYSYKFECYLPTGLPTSLEGKFGQIRYSVIVVLDRNLWSDLEFEEGFTVIKPLNLNAHLALRYPIEREEKRRFRSCCCFFCCTSYPLTLIIRMKASGYTPGQTIQIDFEANNESNFNIRKFYIRLIKIIKYFSQQFAHKTKEEIINLVEVKTTGCLKGTIENYNEQLIVPSVPPTDKTSSNICKVRYAIRIICKVKCGHTDPEINIPITIGTVPFSTDHATSDNENNETTEKAMNGIKINPCSELESPTYEEALIDKADIQGKPFIPMYPVYHSSQIL